MEPTSTVGSSLVRVETVNTGRRPARGPRNAAGWRDALCPFTNRTVSNKLFSSLEDCGVSSIRWTEGAGHSPAGHAPGLANAMPRVQLLFHRLTRQNGRPPGPFLSRGAGCPTSGAGYRARGPGARSADACLARDLVQPFRIVNV